MVVNKATPTITWANPAPITYGAAIGSAQLNATASVAGTFAYSPASGTVLGAGPQTLTVTFTPFNSTFYATATRSVTLTVNKATPTVTVTGGTFPYDGQPHAATGTVRGNGGANLGSPTFTYNGSADPPTDRRHLRRDWRIRGQRQLSGRVRDGHDHDWQGHAEPELEHAARRSCMGRARRRPSSMRPRTCRAPSPTRPAAAPSSTRAAAQALAATFTPADADELRERLGIDDHRRRESDAGRHRERRLVHI